MQEISDRKIQGGPSARGPGLGLVDFDLGVPPSCPAAQLAAQPLLPYSHQTRQNSGTLKIQVNPTQSTSRWDTLYRPCKILNKEEGWEHDNFSSRGLPFRTQQSLPRFFTPLLPPLPFWFWIDAADTCLYAFSSRRVTFTLLHLTQLINFTKNYDYPTKFIVLFGPDKTSQNETIIYYTNVLAFGIESCCYRLTVSLHTCHTPPLPSFQVHSLQQQVRDLADKQEDTNDKYSKVKQDNSTLSEQ